MSDLAKVFTETIHPPLQSDAWSSLTRYHLNGLLSHCASRRSVFLEWETFSDRPDLLGAWAVEVELHIDLVAADARHGGLAARVTIDCRIGDNRFCGEASLLLFQWNPGTFDRANAVLGRACVRTEALDEESADVELLMEVPSIRQVRVWKPRESRLGGSVVMPIEFDLRMADKVAQPVV